MIGICLLKITSPTNLKEPFLGSYLSEKGSDGKFIYGFCNLCIQKKLKTPCKHTEDQRSHTLVLCWPEINYAVSLGYKVLQFYECYQYSTEAPIFKKFFSLLSREKIRYSKPSKDDLNTYLTEINCGMDYTGKLALSAKDIQPNTVKKQYYKDFMNAVLGKMGEQTLRTKTVLVRSQNELDLIDLPSIENIFPLKKSCILFQKNNVKSTRMNIKSNSIIYSYVQSFARIMMFDAMQRLWQQNAVIFSISNDALYFSLDRPIQRNDINEGPLFGQFRNELLDVNRVVAYYSFGSKSSCLVYEDKSGNICQVMKARGFSLSNCISQNVLKSYDVKTAIQKALKNEFSSIFVPQKRVKKSIVKVNVQDQLLLYELTNKIETSRILLSNGESKAYGTIN